MISKERFTYYLDCIKKQQEKDKENAEMFGKIFDTFGSTCHYDNGLIENALVELLAEAMGDTEDKWIEYFIYEIDFGSKKTVALREDKSPIKLRNAGDLYDFLTERK